MSEMETTSDQVSAGQLRAIVERIERLEEEKREIADQAKAVYAEAKANGFDVKTLREVVRLRRIEPEERAEREAMLELYKSALGMEGTPLGEWARGRAEPPAPPAAPKRQTAAKPVPVKQELSPEAARSAADQVAERGA